MGFSKSFMECSEILQKILKEYPTIVEQQKEKLEKIYQLMTTARKVHLYGKGRSSSAASSLALRLKHLGFDVYYLGDFVKEPIEAGDVVMLFSGSGETAEVVDVAKKARMEGAKVIAITSYKESSLAKNSDLIFTLPGGMEKRKGWKYLEAQLNQKGGLYGGGEFELYAYLFQENLVNAIGGYRNIPADIVAKRHERDELIAMNR